MKTTELTLAEAFKSGRPFRRACIDWLHGNAVLTVKSALATDWEIQPLPSKQTWTREEVEELRDRILSGLTEKSYRHDRISELFKDVGL